MEFLRDLLEASKKKKVTRTAASGVYHRDYVKTKKRPYRKYDAEKHAHLSEDFEQDDQSQQQPAGNEELGQHLKALVAVLAKYDQLKSPNSSQQGGASPPLQFSSLFAQCVGDHMFEDKWAFNERPPQEGPGGPASVSNPDANNDVKPVEPSNDDLASVKQAASQHIRQILDIAKQLGQNAEQQLAQAVSKHCGNKARRVMVILTQAAAKMGVQL